MAIVDRIKGMLLAPKSEWPKVAAEPATVQSVYTTWIMLLGLIGPVVILLVTGGAGFAAGIASYVNTLVGMAIGALIADFLAPTFGGTRDYIASLKLVAYAATPMWLAEIALLIPILGPLIVLAGALYAVYLLYLGAPVLKRCSNDKAVAYTIVLLLCAIVLGWILMRVVLSMGFMGAMGAGAPRFGAF